MRLKLPSLSNSRSFSPSPFPFLPFFLGVCFSPFFFLFSLVKSDFLHWGPHACFTNSSCLSVQPAVVLWTTASVSHEAPLLPLQLPSFCLHLPLCPARLPSSPAQTLPPTVAWAKNRLQLLCWFAWMFQWEGSGSEVLASNCYWRERGQRSWTQLSGHLQTPLPPFIVSVPMELRTLPCLGVCTYCPAQDLLLHILIVWPHSWMMGSGNFHCLQKKSSPLIREMMLLCGPLY